MRSREIRRLFLDYFIERDHREVRSSSLVPSGDATLLFTNAGMVQFKSIFLGVEQRDYARATTVQKCVRAGGKHNDLEQVGVTARHHTFFEMLGNFSFGDYFKREAIAYAWEWVTSSEYLGIDPDRLLISVHHEDDEARRLWREVAGISDHRIHGLGDSENYWQMGDTGPSGPCSEIYVDLEKDARDREQLTAEQFEDLSDQGRFLEIWNLVFMQYDLKADGSRVPLPAPSVDTGAGLERIASVLQDVPSNYDTDLFTSLLGRITELVGQPYSRGTSGTSHRVLADHARAVAFLLADGVYPSNEGRGYVLRRILRRAVRHAYLLGCTTPVLTELAGIVVRELGEAYPELLDREEHIRSVTRGEEERFLDTIDGGLKRLDELTHAGGPRVIGGDDAFRLYDTFGFPIDLTEIVAEERGYTVDVSGFEQELGKQRTRSREDKRLKDAGGSGHVAGADVAPAVHGRRRGKWVSVTPRLRQRWVGYETTRAETEILKFRRTDDRIEMVLRDNPFYAESGGQVSDTGRVEGDGWDADVVDVEKVNGKNAIVGRLTGDDFEPTPVVAAVDAARRANIERNHTATHLLHAALHRVLGEHARQAGSVVAPDRLRFDFTHQGPVTPTELRAIEEEVNTRIWENHPIETREMAYRDALRAGAMALFGEKYGDTVRVVDIPGVSLELCGGTHVDSTGKIGVVRLTSESGVAAGVRRLEALSGPGAYDAIRELDDRLHGAADVLRAQPEHLKRRIEALVEENRRLERQVSDLLRGGGGGASPTAEERRLGDVALIIDVPPTDDRQQIGLLMDAFRDRRAQAILVLFTEGDRAGIHVALTDDLVERGLKAGDLVNEIARVSGGRGGGRPHFASAGAGDPTKLAAAREQTPGIVERFLA